MGSKKKSAMFFIIPKNYESSANCSMQMGQLVRSLVGRDKDTYYLVAGCVDNMLYLADGRKRGINNLKKKNIRHVQKCNRIAADAIIAAQGRPLRDEEIRMAIREFVTLECNEEV